MILRVQTKLDFLYKLHIPAGAIHAEGEVEEEMIYIVGISEPGNLLEKLSLLDPRDSPLKK